MKHIAIISLAVLFMALSAYPLSASEEADKPYHGDDAETWASHYGEEWFNYFSKDAMLWFPGGRADYYHNLWISKVFGANPTTKDWTITNRHYVFDDNVYAVEWFYEATYLDDGFTQMETTLAIAFIKDNEIVRFYEYFDDSVGTLQKAGLMPKFDRDGMITPWPKGAWMKVPYRP